VSNVNIKRAVENIRANTTAYTPVVEAVVNAIQAIDEKGRKDGKVTVRALRSNQLEIDGNLPEIVGFEIEDNGVGFTNEHRKSFDTLYSDLKISEGGKGFGRFTCLKHFEDLHVASVTSYRCEICSLTLGRAAGTSDDVSGWLEFLAPLDSAIFQSRSMRRLRRKALADPVKASMPTATTKQQMRGR